MDFRIQVRRHLLKVRKRQDKLERRKLEDFNEAVEQVVPLIREFFQGERPPEAIGAEIRRLVPSESMRDEILKWMGELIDRDPEDAERERDELKEAERRLEADGHRLKCSRKITNALEQLHQALDTDPEAAGALVDAAIAATAILAIAAKARPELFQNVAAGKGMWPVLAKDEPGWEAKAQETITNLKLGERLSGLKTQLRNAQGVDATRPARVWAKAAVATIDHSRWRLQYIHHVIQELGGNEGWADFAVGHGWDLGTMPEWLKGVTSLKPLSMETLKEWKQVVRAMIREQMPDFHERPEWANQRLSAEARGRGTVGVIQNAILDDITSALGTLMA